MAKKKTTKKKVSKKKKMSRTQLEKYIKMASSGKGAKYLLGVKMLGGVPTAGMGMGPGTHGHLPS